MAIAQPERAELVAVQADPVGRVTGVVDQDLLRRDEDPARGAEAGASNVPSARRNFIRLIDDRLHAESSMNMYSEHGFELLIGAVFGQVCHF